MTLYEPEPDAPAVFIYDDTDIHYSFGNSIQLLCYRTVKIKVFKDEGVKWGDVAIDFGNYQLSKEVVSRIDAAAYNLVDGKTVKTQLKRQNIFEEVLDEHTKRLKFSIPEVRAGTVIEYRYLLTSDFIGQIPDVDVQHAIPVVRSTAQISIPEYFTHHIHTRGVSDAAGQKELENGGAAGFSGFSYTNTKYICNIDPGALAPQRAVRLASGRLPRRARIRDQRPRNPRQPLQELHPDVGRRLRIARPVGVRALRRHPQSLQGRSGGHRGTKRRRRAPAAARNPQIRTVPHRMGRNLPADTREFAPCGRRQETRRQRVDQLHPRRRPARRRIQTGNHPAQSPLRRTASADPRYRPHPHLRIADEAQKRGDGLPRCHRPPLGRQRPAHAAARRPRQTLQSGTSFRKLDQPLLAGAERRPVADHGPSDGRGGSWNAPKRTPKPIRRPTT